MSALLSMFLQTVLTASCLPVYNVDDPIGSNPLLIASPSKIASYPVDFVASGDDCVGPIPVWKVPGRYVYKADSEEALVHQMSNDIQDFSKDTGYEACARICKSKEGYFVAQLVTLGSHVSCVASPKTCPLDSVSTEQTVHSHPPNPVFVMNQLDVIGWGVSKDELGRAHYTGEPNEFSPEDKKNAPVWLVAPGPKVFFYDKP